MKFIDKIKNYLKEKKLLNKKTLVIALLILFLIISFIACFISNKEDRDIVIDNDQEEVIDDNNEEENIIDYKQEYIDNYAKNNEYIGHLVFESGLIDQYVSQAKDNSFYLKHAWDKTSFHEGSAFLDYNNDFDSDQNRIIYGHNVAKSLDPTQTHMFTPLHVLEKKENYNNNRFIDLYLSDRKEVYLICRVYTCGIVEIDNVQYIDDDEPIYCLTNYSTDEFNEYLELIKKKEFYSIDESLTQNDKLLTLQTCYETKIDKLIIVSKLIDVEYYD